MIFCDFRKISVWYLASYTPFPLQKCILSYTVMRVAPPLNSDDIHHKYIYVYRQFKSEITGNHLASTSLYMALSKDFLHLCFKEEWSMNIEIWRIPVTSLHTKQYLKSTPNSPTHHQCLSNLNQRFSRHVHVMSGGSRHGKCILKHYTCTLCLEGQDMVNVH